MMSDLERDLHYAMCESANISEAEADRILDAIMTTIKPLGYTRPGLTDAQRKAVKKLLTAWRSSSPVTDGTLNDLVNDLSAAFPPGLSPSLSKPTRPEPPKPERKVQRWEYLVKELGDDYHIEKLNKLGAEGWECVESALDRNPGAKRTFLFKRPIPRDAVPADVKGEVG